jgi:DNA-binding CsgD family transcriptional regulator
LSNTPYHLRFLDLIGTIPVAVVIVDGLESITHVNAAARRTISKCEGKTFPYSLVCGSDIEKTKLSHAIARVRKSSGQVLFLGHPDSSTRPVSILVTAPGSLGIEAQEGSVMILMSIQDWPCVERSTLQELFQFTPSEAKLAVLMMQGRTVSEAAAFLNLTPHSVRTYLKALFQKTGTRRQCELQYVLLTTPSRFAAPHQE